jgi:hypothetical protein
MRHHFRRPQAMFYKGSLFYSHCGLLPVTSRPFRQEDFVVANVSSPCSFALKTLTKKLGSFGGHTHIFQCMLFNARGFV